MDWTAIAVAALSGAALVTAAWLGGGPLLRANRGTRSDVAEIKAEFQPNGGSSARDQLNRIETELRTYRQLVTDVNHVAVRNAERIDEGNALMRNHLEESAANKLAAREEAVEMWKAIRAIHDAQPPEEGTA